jgi:hypothetical protein
MAIRVDPRRLSLLKELAAAEGLRPGQLVQRWVEERLDAERSGETISTARPSGVGAERAQALESSLVALSRRIEELGDRLQRVESAAAQAAPAAEAAPSAQPSAPAEAPRRRGRPRKQPAAAAATAAPSSGKVALHDEIIAVIQDQGPRTAGELASAIQERGRYRPPRSARPLDAATVNGRVSNPVYRARFKRSGRRIGLAD